MPQFRIVVILSGIFAVQNFIPILLLTNGGPGTATLVPGLDMYQSAFQNDQYGYGMAIGTLLFVVMLVFTLAAMRLLRSGPPEPPTSPSHQEVRFCNAHECEEEPSAAAALAATVVLTAAAGCSSGGSSAAAAAAAAPSSSRPNCRPTPARSRRRTTPACKALTQQYEAAHKNVTVQWLPNNTASITAANAHAGEPGLRRQRPRPGVGAVRPGHLRRHAERPAAEHQAVPGRSPTRTCRATPAGCRLFTACTIPYMTSPNGDIDIILGSNVETGMFYSKAAFAKAGITSTPTTWAEFITDLGKLKAAGVTPFMFADGGLCNPSWFERLATSSLLAGQVSQFDVNHAQVTNGLDVAVGINKGIISMSNPRYAEVWKLLGQLASFSASGESSYDACSDPNATTPPLSTQSMLIQGKVGILWGGSWYIPQLDSAGFTGKYGVFPEPPITSASTPLALGTSTVGMIGGPNGNGQWGVTSQQADGTMTPAKTATVMNFLAWLFTPQHLGNWIKINQSGADIPTETGAPSAQHARAEQPGPVGQGRHGGRRRARRRAVDRGDQLGAAAGPGVHRRVAAVLRVRLAVAVAADQLGAAWATQPTTSTWASTDGRREPAVRSVAHGKTWPVRSPAAPRAAAARGGTACAARLPLDQRRRAARSSSC